MLSEKLLDHYYNPRNMGTIEGASAVGEIGNPVCGDKIELYLQIEDEIITDAKFIAIGCGSSIATTSLGTELVIGMHVKDALEFDNNMIRKELGDIPEEEEGCSIIFAELLQEALKNYFFN